MSSLKNSLTIKLTEPVVYLKDVDFTGFRRTHNENAPPSMIRGLLILNLVKPTKITSIEVQLQAKSCAAWPEGPTGRKVETAEEHKMFSAETVFFRASTLPTSRRAISVDPGHLRYGEERKEDDSAEGTDIEQEDHTFLHQSQGSRGRRASADHSTFQRDFISHQESNEVITSPPYSPIQTSPPLSPTSTISNFVSVIGLSSAPTSPVSAQFSQSSSSSRYSMLTSRVKAEDSLGQALEDSRNTLRADSNTTPERSSFLNFERGRSQASRPPSSSTQSQHDQNIYGSNHDRDVNRAHAIDRSQSRDTRPSVSPTRSLITDGSSRGRHSNRISLTAVSTALFGYARSNSPFTPRPVEKDDFRRRGRSNEKGKAKEARPTFIRVSEDGKENGYGWKEFKKGTYTYPISFAIPADSPPSLELDYGSIVWRLKATAHRPGAFTSKLTTSRAVTVVASPSEDDIESTENIMLEKTWDDQMQYLLLISGRCFPIGGKIPVQMTFMPFTKVKIHRIGIVLEEKVAYYTRMKRVAKFAAPSRHVLVSIKYPDKSNRAILPLADEQVDAFRESPFYSVLVTDDGNGSDDFLQSGFFDLRSQIASNLMGPGPWVLQFDAKIPTTCSHLHPTNSNKNSNMTVSHMLKVIYRVERGDSEHLDANGKRKLFDIVIQSPIHILSCLCNSDYTSLPRYTESYEMIPPENLVCGCRNNSKGKGRRSMLHQMPDSAGLFSHFTDLPSPAEAVGSSAGASAMSSPRHYHNDATLLGANTQFERLMTGQESEIGEAPPPYRTRA